VNENTVREICRLLDNGRPLLERLDSFADLERWRDLVVQDSARRLGGRDLVLQQSPGPEHGQAALAKGYESWSDLLTARLQRMRAHGLLRREADPKALAIGIMAAFQGGQLLAQVARDVTPMRAALDMAIGHVRSWRADRASTSRTNEYSPERR
jgi:hypothetical protein